MLVPRSFIYSTPIKGRAKDDVEVKTPGQTGNARTGYQDPWRGFGWRPESFRKHPSTSVRSISPASSEPISPSSPVMSDATRTDSRIERNAETVIARSKPVPVPLKNQSLDSNPLSMKSSNIYGTRRRRSSHKHDTEPLPPSLAALLAMTSIPKKKKFPTTPRSNPVPRRMSTQQLMEQWEQDYADAGTSLSGSLGLDVLLSPPDEDRLSRSESTSSFGGFSYARSLSDESIPSLMGDDRRSGSTLSSSSPLTHGSLRRRPSGRELVSPQSVESTDEHPLSLNSADPDVDFDNDYIAESHTPNKISELASADSRPRRTSTFKSNLTASLSALRSSLLSISNFASTPYSVPEDHLTRGLFAESQRIQREMRPQFLDEPPTPELRRYLNPSAYHLSAPNDFHLHGSRFEHDSFGHMNASLCAVDVPSEGSLIALQDRMLSPISPTLHSALSKDEGMTEAGRAMHEKQQQYRRELRENGEFLRICVLETNMRRAGKIEGPGHAQIWLPARQTNAGQGFESAAVREGKRTPRRWIGESV